MRGRVYRSQQEPATVPGLRGRIGKRVDTSRGQRRRRVRHLRSGGRGAPGTEVHRCAKQVATRPRRPDARPAETPPRSQDGIRLLALSEHWCRSAAYCPGFASTRATRREQDHGRCMPGALADHGRSTECVSVACCQVGSTQHSISIRYEPAPAVIRCCRMSGTTPAAVAKSASSCRMVR